MKLNNGATIIHIAIRHNNGYVLARWERGNNVSAEYVVWRVERDFEGGLECFNGNYWTADDAGWEAANALFLERASRVFPTI